jgi:prevent-host-death family protein
MAGACLTNTEVHLNIALWSSRRARANWRDVLDLIAASEADVVVTRHGQPAAAVIAYEDYVAIQDDLEELRSARRGQAALERWRMDPASGRNYAEIRRELVADGLLDSDET